MSQSPLPRAALVVGAGGWGTALACVLARGGYEVRLWARRPEFAAHLQVRRENDTYLPDVALAPNISATADPSAAASGADLVVFATPTQAMAEVAALFRAHIAPHVPLISASKGIDIDTLHRPTEVLRSVFCAAGQEERPLLSLSGPNFAAEVARGLPAASVLACGDLAAAERCRAWFSGQPSFRLYTRTDVVGVELGGALKNVIAIIAGIADGLALGLNARAAIITRGLAEIARLGVAMGADPLTFAGLSGMGDLVLTCTGSLSRNQWAGRELAHGKVLAEIVGGTRMVIEGISTTKAACALAGRYGVEMPLAQELYQVLFADKPVHDMVRSLLSRSLRDEGEYRDPGLPELVGRRDPDDSR